ncbi:MAG: DUF2235 domain-containing protein [Ignavibacteriaceae bacterium]|nr:DUF2235 domain-containing protein [Ignavibacteriaceae bacterium]MCW8814172.1 DUF2235 domain-containing protein [Chlorobium sp.]MCW8816881.1 DUF2235 domain-containing protein [Ignavibacteriaceae bacterium]MCW8961069.1 DUF2235 domain-containing protein [Ignavibacteriaceae bacterium]MCW9098168.1 DUF2235 domain-containing protein [Ignavibacteriaceae bacterium]
MSKNIIVCCDGTGNEFGDRNTNVVKLFEIIDKIPDKQIAYYDPGVGTFSAPGAITKTQKFITKLFGLAFGYGITKNIEDAYEYLMDKYEENDYVYLFGFSRGAFTVRALAGMLYKCGLLEKGSNNLIPYATRMYRYKSESIAHGFKKTFCRECKPHFIGVWDTVKSVGIIKSREFPNAVLNPDVNIGVQALSIDENRRNFKPSLWEKVADSNQYIRQVWFAGFHSDVGGSFEDSGLSDIALKWIIDKASKNGLIINGDAFSALKPENVKGKMHNLLFPIWWLLGWTKREIINGSYVHKTVFERIDQLQSYKPKNLPKKEDLIQAS